MPFSPRLTIQARQREERVEEMRQRMVRRLKHQGLTRAIAAWQEQREIANRMKRLMASASTRVAFPRLAMAFAHLLKCHHAAAKLKWLRRTSAHMGGSFEGARLPDAFRQWWRRVETSVRLATAARAAEREASGAEDIASLQRALVAAKEHEVSALERQRLELTGSAEQRLAAKERRLREQRVEEMHTRAVRALCSSLLHRGWSLWFGGWDRARRIERLLRGGVMRLVRPAVTRALVAWRNDWLGAEQMRKMGASVAQRDKAVARVKAQANARLDAAEKALAEAKAQSEEKLERLKLELTGTAEERMRARETRLKEEAIEATHKKALRRLQHRGIMQGWTTWVARAQQQRRLQRVVVQGAARVSKPKELACLTAWRRDWELGVFEKAAARRRANLTQKEAAAVDTALADSAREWERLVTEKERSLSGMRRELREQRDEHARDLIEAQRHEEAVLERLRKELSGTAHEQLLAREARLKEERVEGMYARAVRRLVHQETRRGWGVWHARHRKEARLRRVMARGTTRLTRPRVVAVYEAWRRDWAATEKRLQHLSWDERLRRERFEMAEERHKLEDVVRALERQLRDAGLLTAVPVPPPEPKVLLLHGIFARDVPQDGDGPARRGGVARGTDPYVRFILLDAGGSATTQKGRQQAFTSYLQNAVHPAWEDERLQLRLTPGGDRPVRLRVEVWDKDMYTPDEQLAGAVVELVVAGAADGGNVVGAKGTVQMRLDGIMKPSDDIRVLGFAWSLLEEEEPEQRTRKNHLLKQGEGRQNARDFTGGRKPPVMAVPATSSSSSSEPKPSGAPQAVIDEQAPTAAAPSQAGQGRALKKR